MSKSRGNTVAIDEAIFRVYSVTDGYQFIATDGRVVDWEAECVWRDRHGTDEFFTGSPKRERVFLVEQ